MRGISFQIINQHGNILDQIFQGIDLKKFKWNITEQEVFHSQTYENLFEEKENMNGTELLEYIKVYNQYLILFINLKGYLTNYTEVDTKMDTYDDFLKSCCEIMLLINDVVFIEIYCKNQEYIEIIKTNAERNHFTDIEYTTGENDGRTRLHVW